MEAQSRPGAREAIFAQLVDAGRSTQVAQRLTDGIILGMLQPGERLPSEPELARRFGVALITVREGLVILREAGLIQTKRGREGGSFVTSANVPRDGLLHARLRGLTQVELSDMAVYFSTIVEGCATRAAMRASTIDGERIEGWLRNADFTTPATGRANTGGFYLELAVLSQSARLVQEQIRVQAEFGPLLLLGLDDTETRVRIARDHHEVVHALRTNDAARAHDVVAGQIRELAQWLLAAKARVERVGAMDVTPHSHS